MDITTVGSDVDDDCENELLIEARFSAMFAIIITWISDYVLILS